MVRLLFVRRLKGKLEGMSFLIGNIATTGNIDVGK